MDREQMKKIGLIIIFALLAGISCWATTESLHLLLPSWPKFFCWVVTIAFFIIASYGSKLIMDSLNMNIYLEKRRTRMVLGILLLLVFWLCFSMPTNTHTFFYRSAINDVVLQDVGTTKSYLQDLADNSSVNNRIKANIEKVESEVKALQIALENEIDNKANAGFGDRAKEHLRGLALALGVAEIPTLSGSGNTPAKRKALKEQYSQIIHSLLENRIEKIKVQGMDNRVSYYQPEAKKLVGELKKAEVALAEEKAKGNVNQKLISNVDALLVRSYTTVNNYSDLINISDEDKEVYKSGVTRTHRMLSVIEVWRDIFNGKFGGREVVLWILLSVLVDIAAFVFFSLATARDDE